MVSQELMNLYDRLKDLHKLKSSDYATDDDPFSNYRAAEAIGVPAWKSALARAAEKFERVKNFCKRGNLNNESFEDALTDLGATTLIALCLYQESLRKEGV